MKRQHRESCKPAQLVWPKCFIGVFLFREPGNRYMRGPLNSLLRGTLEYLFSGMWLLSNSWVRGGKANNSSSSQPSLSSVSSSPTGVELHLSCFNQGFHHNRHLLRGIAIGGAFGQVVTFGQVFKSFCLRRGNMDELGHKRSSRG